jgi:hypothetical protein
MFPLDTVIAQYYYYELMIYAIKPFVIFLSGIYPSVRLPKDKKVGCSKWIFKRKKGLSCKESARFKTRLVAKDFSEISGIDYNDDEFCPIVKHSFIHAFFGIVVCVILSLSS